MAAPPPDERARAVREHYARPQLVEAIRAALAAARSGERPLEPDDLSALDEFHTGGRGATRELAALAGISGADHVVDVGGGLGGPARRLARTVGCTVTVVDLTPDYCAAAALLGRLTGIAPLVRVIAGDATRLPLCDECADVVWTQHSTMNAADKRALWGECLRVLRPGGRLALYEVMAGQGGPPHLPVPWARDAAASHLQRPEDTRALLRELGARERCWEDVSAAALARLAAPRVATRARPLLGLGLLLGDDLAAMLDAQRRNLAEDRVRVIRAVLEKGGR